MKATRITSVTDATPPDLLPITKACSPVHARAMLSGAIQARIEAAASHVQSCRALGIEWTWAQHDGLLDGLSSVEALSMIAASAGESVTCRAVNPEAGQPRPPKPDFEWLRTYLE